jgi:hypothetical protein
MERRYEARYVAFGLAAVVIAGATVWRQAHERHGFAWRPVATTADGRVFVDTNEHTGEAWMLAHVTGGQTETAVVTVRCASRALPDDAAPWARAVAPAVVAVVCDSLTSSAARP